MTTLPPQPQQIQLHIPPSLLPYTTPLSTFLATNPLYAKLAVSAIILSPPTSPSHHHPPSPHRDHNHDQSHPLTTNPPRRMLLLRRAPTERAFPSKWELPGGSAETSDPTVLHSVAREVFEETGLKVCRFVREVGCSGAETCTKPGAGMQKMDFTTGKGVWAKRVFEVEVVEMTHGKEKGKEESEVEVELDPAEHTEFLWADREEVEKLRGKMVSEAVYGVVVEGLEGR